MKSKKRNENVKSQVILALFSAIILLMTFTPIGLIDLPIIKATLLHVPVIIGSVSLGPKKGAFLGFVFGLASLIKNSTAPSLLSFAFTPVIPLPGLQEGSLLALIICFIPRILVGITPYFTVKGIEFIMHKIFKKKLKAVRPVGITVAAVVGAFTNTILVMGMIYLFFREPYAIATKNSIDAIFYVILGVIGTNGFPEAIVAAVISTPVCLALDKLFKRLKIKRS